MMKQTMLKLAASGLILAAGTVACSPNGRVASASSEAPANPKAARSSADAASAALKNHQPVAAVLFAERAVAQQPKEAQYRLLLGQSYLAAGRFASATTSYQEALTLDPSNGRAVLNLALAQIAMGQSFEGRQTLVRAKGIVGDADLGLALALAGDREGAIAVLEPAARAKDADAKVRQNLALSYALAGRWAEARVMAAQDISPAALDARMTSWAKLANPQQASDQVAMLLNITPAANDQGRPVALALGPIAAKPAALAQAEPVAAPAPAPEPVAAQAPAPQAVEPAAEPVIEAPAKVAQVQAPEIVPAATAEPAPIAVASNVAVIEKPSFIAPLAAVAAPIASEAPLVRQVALVAQKTPTPMFVRPAAAPKAAAKSGAYVVQLGAFSSSARLQAAWGKARKQMAYLGSYAPVGNVYRSSLYRLSVSGFAKRADATAMCSRMHDAGIPCFVRANAGDAPLEWASKDKGIKLASR